MEQRTLDEVALWVNQYAAARQQVSGNLATQAASVWLSFTGWYDERLVAQLAAEMAGLSGRAQGLVVGSSQRYVANVVAAMRGAKVHLPRTTVPPVRKGADPLRVHTRPAEVFRQAFATGDSEAQALDKAVKRAEQLAQTDVMLAGRGAQREQMKALDVRGYRRVLHPELSKSGSCGLCVVASDRIYHVEDLMPIHAPSCECEALPIIGTNDPGKSLNREDLDKIYAAAGSTAAEDLRRVRVAVNEHGEYGPVLTDASDSFRGPKNVPLEQDPARARRMLDKAAPVLQSLEQRAAVGEDVTGPLQYQRDLAARLQRITDQAA